MKKFIGLFFLMALILSSVSTIANAKGTIVTMFLGGDMAKEVKRLRVLVKDNPGVFKEKKNDEFTVYMKGHRYQAYKLFEQQDDPACNCSQHITNGFRTDKCGSFEVDSTAVLSENPNNFKVISPFSMSLNTKVEKVLKKHGYDIGSGLNVSTAFVAYILHNEDLAEFYSIPFHPSRIHRILGVVNTLSNMINEGKIIDFEKLVNYFITDKILIKN